MFGGNKKVIRPQANLQLKAADLFKYACPFVTTRHYVFRGIKLKHWKK